MKKDPLISKCEQEEQEYKEQSTEQMFKSVEMYILWERMFNNCH